MSSTYTTVGGDSICFDQASSVESARTELVERKVCEGGCGGAFYRPLPKTAREGEKLCPRCRAREEGAETRDKENAAWRRDPRKVA